jgi:hypothetical protein
MGQGTYTVAAILLAFLFFVTARGELPIYLQLLI